MCHDASDFVNENLHVGISNLSHSCYMSRTTQRPCFEDHMISYIERQRDALFLKFI
jgi:hypothetical protein